MSIALTALMLPVVAGVTSMLVLRIRSLVRASRQRDLLGKYILGPRLGAGGMAEVFSATYSPEGGFERQVAVKRILPSFSSDPSAIALFRREAELGATLAHPNLVHVLDFGSDGDTYFLAMEFVDGANLGDLCADNRKHGRGVEPLVVAYIAWCLADALEHVHEHVSPSGQHLRLVHRDLNPPNILISRSGDVKLADFGIIREVAGANLTQAGLMRGKLPYAAPEQIERDQIDGRADLFALGITLWELLAGRRLFTGANDAEIARALLSMPVPALHELAPAAPQALIAIIDGLLERDLEHRTPSAQALRQQLGALPTDLLDIRAGRARLAAIVTLIAQKRANTALVRGDKSDETTTEMRPHSA